MKASIQRTAAARRFARPGVTFKLSFMPIVLLTFGLVIYLPENVLDGPLVGLESPKG